MATKPTMDVEPSGSRPSHDVDDEVERQFLGETDDELELIDLVRERLGIGDEPSDVTIAASLAAIAAKGDARGRWLAAVGSPLGRWLASRGTDLNTALNTLLAVAPRPMN